MSKNTRILSSKQGLKNSLFNAIQTNTTSNQQKNNNSLNKLSKLTNLSAATIKGSASFYDFLNAEAKSQEVFVCHGSACLNSGTTKKLIKKYPDAGKSMCCGYCYQGSALLKRNFNGNLDAFCQTKNELKQPQIPVYSVSSFPILTSVIESISSLYIAALDKKDEIIAQLEKSKLRGRGGAGFSFAFKCDATAKAKDDEKYIVCNADEGDPGAFSDRYLLEKQSHKIMAGMYASGIAAGAKVGILYIRKEYPYAIKKIKKAINEFNNLPNNITKNFSFYIVSGAGSYVCGEETALLNSIEGLRPEVRTRPPYPATYGLWGKPTIVSNVETFANIPWILINGGTAYANIGTKLSKGTKLISLDSQFKKPGLYELDFGYSFDKLINENAKGFNGKIKALQVGGPLGSIVAIRNINKLTIDFESFQDIGFALGHGGIVSIAQNILMIDFMTHIFEYMTEESCGKCTPCRLGTAKGSRMLKNASIENKLDKNLFTELLELLQTGSLCALGSGIPLPMRNIMDQFRDELSPYFTKVKKQI